MKRVPSEEGAGPDDPGRAMLRVVSRSSEPGRGAGGSASDGADRVQVLRDQSGTYLMTASGVVPVADGDAPTAASGAGESLGVTVVQRTDDPLRRLRVEPHGLVILTVTPRSRAARAGLRPGDVIERVNRLPLIDVEMLRRAVQAMNTEPLLLQVVRHESRFFITANAW